MQVYEGSKTLEDKHVSPRWSRDGSLGAEEGRTDDKIGQASINTQIVLRKQILLIVFSVNKMRALRFALWNL
jgi:hypothetical protein